jgi:hypothetical protein
MGAREQRKQNKKYLDKPLNLKKKVSHLKKSGSMPCAELKIQGYFFVKNNREVPFFFSYSNDHITFSKG